MINPIQLFSVFRVSTVNEFQINKEDRDLASIIKQWRREDNIIISVLRRH